jgi:hypothetical protein
MTTHELAEHLRAQGIQVLRVVSRTVRRKKDSGDLVKVGDIELSNDPDLSVDENGVMYLRWWMPEQRHQVAIGTYQSAQVSELVQAIKDHRP